MIDCAVAYRDDDCAQKKKKKNNTQPWIQMPKSSLHGNLKMQYRQKSTKDLSRCSADTSHMSKPQGSASKVIKGPEPCEALKSHIEGYYR